MAYLYRMAIYLQKYHAAIEYSSCSLVIGFYLHVSNKNKFLHLNKLEWEHRSDFLHQKW